MKELADYYTKKAYMMDLIKLMNALKKQL